MQVKIDHFVDISNTDIEKDDIRSNLRKSLGTQGNLFDSKVMVGKYNILAYANIRMFQESGAV